MHRILQKTHELFSGFSDGKAADRNARRIERRNEESAFFAEIFKKIALNDRKEKTAITALGLPLPLRKRPLRPIRRNRQSALGFFSAFIPARAHVELHLNIAVEFRLRFNDVFGSKKVPRTVDVTLERDAFGADLPKLCERKHLETARIGEKIFLPLRKTVQPARFFYQIGTGTQKKVVGIGEDDFKADLFERFFRHGFDRRIRSDRHKDGSSDSAVRQRQQPRPRRAVGTRMVHFKNIHFYVLVKRKRRALIMINRITGNHAPEKAVI